MRSTKTLLFLLVAAVFVAVYLFNTLTSPAVQGPGGLEGTRTPSAANQTPGAAGTPGGNYIEVETPSGIEQLRAERITFVILNAGKLGYDSKLSVAGYLFDKTEEVTISIYDPNGKLESEVGTAQTDEEGNLAWYAFDVPQQVAPGKHVVRVVGENSGKKAEASFTLRAGGPWVNPSTYSGKPNSTVEFSGGGYQPGETVEVYFDSVGGEPIGTYTADKQGGCQISLSVPLANEADHAFIIVGKQSNAPIRIPFSVLGFHPWGSLTNYSPQPNQAVGFVGHDFVPGEEVRVYLNQLGPEAIATATVDGEGNFEIADTYYPPAGAVGEKNAFLFVGNISQTVIYVPFEVLPLTPDLGLTVYSGSPGSPVGFTGQGFVPKETLRAYLGKPEPGKEVSTFEAGEDGSFEDAGTFNIPYSGLGSSVSITLVGDKSLSPISMAFAVLPYAAWANLSVYFGPPGTELVLDGGGFAPNEEITVHFQNRQSPSALTIQTGAEGSFEKAGPVAVPPSGGENISIILVGDKSGAEVTKSFSFKRPEPGPENAPSPPANEKPSEGSTPTPVPGGDGGEKPTGQ